MIWKIEEIKGNIIKYKPRKFTIRGVNYEGKHNYYVLLFGFHDTILLGNYIYKDSETIRMKRKYYKFLNAKELREKYVEEKRVREWCRKCLSEVRR